MSMKDVAGLFGKADTLELPLAVRVEEAELDSRGMGREDRDVDAPDVQRDPQRLGRSLAEAAHRRRAFTGSISPRNSSA